MCDEPAARIHDVRVAAFADLGATRATRVAFDVVLEFQSPKFIPHGVGKRAWHAISNSSIPGRTPVPVAANAAAAPHGKGPHEGFES